MSGFVGSLTASTLYPVVSKNEQAEVTKFEAWDPSTRAALAYFRKAAGSITSPKALLGDYRALKVVLSAFGMSSQIGSTALLKQLMTQDPTSPSSLAQRSANPAWQRFARFMSSWNPPPLSNASVVSTIANQFATNSYEAAEGKQAAGLQEALYFRRTIGSIRSVYGLLSDPSALKVAVTASNLPPMNVFGALDYNEQISLLTKTFDLTKFRDPAYVDKFVRKYLAMNQANSYGFDAGGLASVFSSGSGGPDLLSSLYPNSTTSLLGALFSTSA